jgi:phospholipase/carboxylesterase
MRAETIGGLTAHVTGGTDREGGGSGPAVVLLHGFGASGDDLVSLWRGLDVPQAVRFVFPSGPIALERAFGDSRAWWMIDFGRMEEALGGDIARLVEYEPPGIVEARRMMMNALDDVEKKLGVTSDRLILGGFSQGANLSADIALVGRRKVAGLVMMSGAVLEEKEWLCGMDRVGKVPVFMSHGRSDPVLPYVLSERVRRNFSERGFEVEWVSFSGGHEIPWRVVEKLGPFITRVVGG